MARFNDLDLAGVMAMKGYGDLWDSIASFIPENTIVGKAARGDWSGATAGALNLARPQASSGSAMATTPRANQPPSSQQMPQWLLPVGIGVAVLVLLPMVMKRR